MKKPPEKEQEIALLCRHERLAERENRLRAEAKAKEKGLAQSS